MSIDILIENIFHNILYKLALVILIIFLARKLKNFVRKRQTITKDLHNRLSDHHKEQFKQRINKTKKILPLYLVPVFLCIFLFIAGGLIPLTYKILLICLFLVTFFMMYYIILIQSTKYLISHSNITSIEKEEFNKLNKSIYITIFSAELLYVLLFLL